MKKIVHLSTVDEDYPLEGNSHGMIIKDIIFRRDGYQGVFKCQDEAHYIIKLENPMTEKDVTYKLVPMNRLKELLFIEISERKELKENLCETAATDLTLAGQ
jgi:hypothetical protein